jgi:N6-adenosine-specific RNA methylase IME4
MTNINHEVSELKSHPAAEILPLIEGDAFDQLVEDIRVHGQQEAITLTEDGLIVDGRNRYRACKELGIKPRTCVIDESDPVAFVLSLNLHRRHLDESQRAMVSERLANLPRGTRQDRSNDLSTTTQAQAAKLLNVSVPSAKRARKVRAKGTSKLVAAVEQGKIPVSTAAQIASRPESAQDAIVSMVEAGARPVEAVRTFQRETLGDRIADIPSGLYRVVYADPPWKYSDERELEGYTGTAAENSYPTMTMDLLTKIEIPSADDAVLFMWATAPLLPDAFALGKAWGFVYKQNIVWDKVKSAMGGLGNYTLTNHEHLLIFTRGSCVVDGEKIDSVQSVEKSKQHSCKPEHFRTLIDSMYPDGPRIELFRRGDAPDGWVVWGNEVETAEQGTSDPDEEPETPSELKAVVTPDTGLRKKAKKKLPTQPRLAQKQGKS